MINLPLVVPEKQEPVDEKGDILIESEKKIVRADDKKSQRIQRSRQPVDESDPQKVVLRGVKGTVKWFSVFDGFGFIHRSDNKMDVFVHKSAVVQPDDRFWGTLTVDQEVEFDVVAGFKGPRAVGVTLPGGLPIENARFVNRPFHRRRFVARRTKSENYDEKPGKEKSGSNRRRRNASESVVESGDEMKKDAKPRRKYNSKKRPQKIKDVGDVKPKAISPVPVSNNPIA